MADKNTYYILLQPKLDKSSITEMESKFKQASKRIGANLGSALKSSVKGAATSMVAQLSIANILGNAFSSIMQAPDKVKNLAMEMRQLAIQTKNVSTIGDLETANFGGFYQGLQSAGFQGDLNDIREVFAETGKAKAKGGRFEGSKLETGELLARTLQSWQNIGKKFGVNSQEFQDAKKEVEQIIGGVDTARKFESLVKGDKTIEDIYKTGKKELGIKNSEKSSKIYEENLKTLQGLSTQSQETKMQKFLFNKKIDPKSVDELKRIQDSDFNMTTKMMSDSDKLSAQITLINDMKNTQEDIKNMFIKILNLVVPFMENVIADFNPKEVRFDDEYTKARNLALKQTGLTDEEVKLFNEKLKQQYGNKKTSGRELDV
jgi:hypothetical protein